MIRRSTWILFLVFLIFVAITIYWERSRNTSEELSPTSTPQASMLNLDSSNVARVAILASQGEKITFAKNDANNWTIEEPLGEVDANADFGSSIERFITAKALSTLESPPPLDAAGLGVPPYTITITLQDGSQIIVLIGSVTVTDSGYYVQVKDDFIVVDKFSIDNILDLLINPPYLTPEAEMTPENGSVTPSP